MAGVSRAAPAEEQAVSDHKSISVTKRDYTLLTEWAKRANMSRAQLVTALVDAAVAAYKKAGDGKETPR